MRSISRASLVWKAIHPFMAARAGAVVGGHAAWRAPRHGIWFAVTQPEHGLPSGRHLPSTKHQRPWPRRVAASGSPVSALSDAAASAVVWFWAWTRSKPPAAVRWRIARRYDRWL